MKKIILSSLVLASALFSADLDMTKESELVTHTEFGYNRTTGNTDTQTFSLDAKATKNWQMHVASVLFDGQYSSDGDVETKNKYYTEAQYDYKFTDRFALNYLIAYKADKFSAYGYQFFTGPGIKYKAIAGDVHNLSLEGNVLYAVDEILDENFDGNGELIEYPNPDDVPTAETIAGKTDSYAAYRTKAVYTWQMLEHMKFEQEISYRGSFEDASNHFVFSKTGLTGKISDIFSAGVSFKYDFVNEPGDLENTDTTLTANLIMDY